MLCQGLAGERKRRWCAACAKSHPEAIDITNKRCEDCTKAEARFGLAEEGKKRWCHTGPLTQGAIGFPRDPLAPCGPLGASTDREKAP